MINKVRKKLWGHTEKYPLNKYYDYFRSVNENKKKIEGIMTEGIKKININIKVTPEIFDILKYSNITFQEVFDKGFEVLFDKEAERCYDIAMDLTDKTNKEIVEFLKSCEPQEGVKIGDNIYIKSLYEEEG